MQLQKEKHENLLHSLTNICNKGDISYPWLLGTWNMNSDVLLWILKPIIHVLQKTLSSCHLESNKAVFFIAWFEEKLIIPQGIYEVCLAKIELNIKVCHHNFWFKQHEGLCYFFTSRPNYRDWNIWLVIWIVTAKFRTILLFHFT